VPHVGDTVLLWEAQSPDGGWIARPAITLWVANPASPTSTLTIAALGRNGIRTYDDVPHADRPREGAWSWPPKRKIV
jgi:hypothetical protein